MIKDSGNRTVYESGAVRDIQEDKGRCDLMPIFEVGLTMRDTLLMNLGKSIVEYKESNGDWMKFRKDLSLVINEFAENEKISIGDLMLEVSMHFKEGAEKYGENNWQKGIPTHSYIDSAIRHYIKHKSGYKDERHDRAFVWNLLCLMWTIINKPEMDDIVVYKGE